MKPEPPSERDADIAARYDRDADAYRRHWAPVLHVASRHLVTELGVKGRASVQRILDVGTGVGTNLDLLRHHFPAAELTGLDRSRGMLAHAPRSDSRVLADAQRLPIATESVDLVLQAFLLFLLEDPGAALREARRTLRSGGRIAVATWARTLDSLALRTWRETLDQHGAVSVERLGGASLSTVEELRATLLQSGFDRARAWIQPVSERIDAEHLIALNAGTGRQRRRLDTLEPAAREAFLVDIRRRLQGLPPEAFEATGAFALAIGERAAAP